MLDPIGKSLPSTVPILGIKVYVIRNRSLSCNHVAILTNQLRLESQEILDFLSIVLRIMVAAP